MKNSGFTLLELLIVIGILALVSTITVLMINPTEIFKETRDAIRFTDIANLSKIFQLIEFDNSNFNFGSANVLYISLPDNMPDCSSYSSLPILPNGWSYSCKAQANYRKVDGTGWIPIDFTTSSLSIQSPLSTLPLDPVNSYSSHTYYTYRLNNQNKPIVEARRFESRKHFCPNSAYDAENNVYDTVIIGDQCWLKGNLRATKYWNGTLITDGTWAGGAWFADNAYYSCPPNTSNNGPDCAAASTLGYLYQWSAAMNSTTTEGAQGICPFNWHIPTDWEQFVLEDYLKDNEETCFSSRIGTLDCATAGAKLKSGGSSGFEGLLAGKHRTYSLCVGEPPVCTPYFAERNAAMYFWSSTESSNPWLILHRGLSSSVDTVLRWEDNKTEGISIRCLRDD